MSCLFLFFFDKRCISVGFCLGTMFIQLYWNLNDLGQLLFYAMHTTLIAQSILNCPEQLLSVIIMHTTLVDGRVDLLVLDELAVLDLIPFMIQCEEGLFVGSRWISSFWSYSILDPMWRGVVYYSQYKIAVWRLLVALIEE